MPPLIADLGEQAAWRYVEFFTANIRNPNTAGLRPRMRPVLRLGARIAALDTDRHPAS